MARTREAWARSAVAVVLILGGMFVVLALRGCGLVRAPRGPGRAGADPVVAVLVTSSGKVVKLPLEEYVRGVVAAEVPALFHPEALKAQAVLARTLAVRRMRAFGGAGLEGGAEADLSDDATKGQAWMADAQLKARWGQSDFRRYWERVAAAVAATKGLIATYQGAPIDPVYHSTCGGRTENAEEVWTAVVPYLRSVICPADGHARDYTRLAEFTFAELEARFGAAAGSLRAATKVRARAVVEVIRRSSTGRATLVRVGERTVTGSEFRRVLGLRSTLLTVVLGDGRVTITTTGYGHGVGLCQYGADGLAKRGETFGQILSHYYQGVEIRPLSQR
jgi:stage II sporulation protein D